MDDAIIMTTTFLDSLHPPLPIVGRGTGGRLASPAVGCEECGQPLIETRVNHHFVRQCDNPECHRFKGRQGIRKARMLFPSYPKALKRHSRLRYKRYLALRAGGLSAIQASRYRDTTSMTVSQIIKMFQKERNQ